MLAAGLALVAALHVVFALRKGLVLDELHSLFHASRPSAAAFFETLLRDNHPPLSFLLIAGARALIGESELALRAPALVAAALEIALVARLGRRLAPGAGLVAAALLAVSSLHLDFATQARMYAPWSLAVTAAVLAAVTLLERPAGAPLRGPSIALALSLALAFHLHYFTVQYAAGLALAALAAAAVAPEWRPRVRRLALPLASAAALCLPWTVLGLRAQLAHGLPPGGDDAGLGGLAEALVHLFFLNVRLGGPLVRPIYVAAGVLVHVLAAAGAWRLVRDRERRPFAVLLAGLAWGVPAAAAAAAALWPRAGFTWHYVLPSAAATALLAAASVAPGAFARAHRGALAAVAACAFALTAQNALSRGTQDYPGAIRAILDGFRPGDAVITVEFQPPLFPPNLPWHYYAPRLAAPAAPPSPLPMRGVHLADPSALARYGRVHLLRTSLPGSTALMRQLAERYPFESSAPYGFGITRHLFARSEPR